MDDIHSAAVRAEHHVAVVHFGDGQDLDVFDAVLFVIDAGDDIVFHQRHAARAGNHIGAVHPFQHRADTIGGQPVFHGEAVEAAAVIAQQRGVAVGGEPELFFAVADDGTDARLAEDLQQIVLLFLYAVGIIAVLQRHRFDHRAVVENAESLRFCADEQLIVIQAGGIDHLVREPVFLVEIHKVVRHDLHHAL